MNWPLVQSVALRFTRAVDGISRVVGLVAIWLVLLSASVSAFNALFRYSVRGLIWLEQSYGGGVFGGLLRLYSTYANVLNESAWYMFGGMVMLGGAWTLKVNEHVRVDLLYGWVSERTRTWIDLLGGLIFLLPLCLILIWFTWPWFWRGLVSGEVSSAAGGLPRWPVRLMLPLGFGVLALQGLAEIVKCVLALTTDYVREYAYEKPVQ